MGINKRQYSKEQKEEIVQVLLGGQTALQLGREHNISPGLINRWRRQYLKGELNGHNDNQEIKRLQIQIAKLEQIIGKLAMENYMLKKRARIHHPKEKRRFIHHHRQLFHTLKEGCRLMGMPRSTYYYQVKEERVLRIMRQLGIRGRIKRIYTVTTNSKHNNRVYPNLINDKIAGSINQIWCSDITYIRILSGFVYLAAILDIYSRRIAGYAIGKTLSADLTLAALRMALATRKVKKLIHHSDQGVQYASLAYTDLLKKHVIAISMAAKGNPYDNAYVESFFKTLKHEEVYLWQYET